MKIIARFVVIAIYSLFSYCLAVTKDNHGLARQVIIIAGNFTLDGEAVNIAEYEIDTGIWSNKYQAELIMARESTGVIWDVVVNESSRPYSSMYVVGSFDTITKTSQVQFCSVGAWDGLLFEKVGEGLCPRGIDFGDNMVIRTTVLGSDGDLFVGGSFGSRVWDGDHFVNVFHVAHYYGKSSSWYPLGDGQLRCKDGGKAKVNALAWDSENSVLYLGGQFQLIENRTISAGLAMWSKGRGLVSFPGGGIAGYDGNYGYAEVSAIAYESISQSLFVAGSFDRVRGEYCPGVAVWQRVSNEWKCLHRSTHQIIVVTAMFLDNKKLYLSGWASQFSSWDGRSRSMPYAIASLDIGGYIDEYYCQVYDCTSANINSNYHDDSKSNFRDDREKNSRPSRRPSSEYHRRLRRSNSYNDTEKREISYLTTPSKANSNSSNSVHYSPTPEPTPKPMWAVNWNWLPGFNGGDGPILEIKRGKGDYRNSLYIVGAFQNYPSIVIWNENSDYFQSNTSILGGSTAIKGLVTSVSHVLLPYQADQPISMPIGPVSNKRDYYTILILTCSVLAGVILGLGVAAGYYSNKTSYSAIPTIDIDNENDNNGEVKVGMSLMTLTDVRQPDYVDFKDCFERAMRARHLPTHESLFVINPKEIVLSRVIGEGSFGRVWSGQWGNTAVAVKEFVFAQAAVVGGSIERNNIIEEFVGEAGIMACLRHPKILQLYGCTMTMQAIWIVSELCVRGSLRMLLNDRSTELSQLTMLSISLDIADGLHYLHTRSPPIIHRDMKSHNVFIHEQSPGKFVAKIGDWGSARAIALTGAKSMTQGVGTACWLSPEVIYNAHFSKASDVYAFGIILWEIYTRQEIYEGMTAAQIIAKVAHDGLRPVVPRDCPWARVMTECWKQNEWERPELKSLVWALRKIYNRVSRKLRKKKSSDNLANKRDRSASLDSIGKNSTGSYTLDVVEENSIFVEHAQETSNPTKLEDQVRKLLKAKLSDDSLAKELENHYENSYSSREIRTDTATVAIDDTPHINITPETPRWPSSSFSNSYVIDDLEMNEAVDGKDEYNKKCSPVSDSAKSRISSGYSVFDLDLNNIDSELYPSRNSSGSRHVSDKGYIHPGEEPEFTPPAKHYERKIIEDKANNLNHTAASAGIADMDNSLSTVKTSTKAELTGSPGKFGTMGSKTVNSAESMTNPHQKADSSQQAIDDGNDIARYMAGTSLSRSDDESIPTQHMKVDYGIISKATYSTNADMMRSAPSTASKTRRSRNVESRDSLPSDTSQPVRNNGTTQNIIRSNDNEQMEAKHTVDDSETHGSNYKLLLQKYSEGMHGSYDTT